jgi:thioredoxin reductase (NADPH)
MPLTDGHAAKVERVGRHVFLSSGVMVQGHGNPSHLFDEVIEGESEAGNPLSGQSVGAAMLGRGQLQGDLEFLSDGQSLSGAGALRDTRNRVLRDKMLRLMSNTLEKSDIAIST